MIVLKLKQLIIEDTSIDKSYSVSFNIVQHNFIHYQCRTCLSLQGSGIIDTIAIFEWSFHGVEHKWVHTAVTRAAEFNNLYLFSGKNEEFEDT